MDIFKIRSSLTLGSTKVNVPAVRGFEEEARPLIENLDNGFWFVSKIPMKEPVNG